MHRVLTSIDALPRIALIGDNRDNPNWGSRSTTMALLGLLENAALTPGERLTDGEVQRRVAVSRLPAIDALLRRPRLRRLAEGGIARGGRSRAALERFLGLSDAVFEDPAATVAAWRRRPDRPELAHLVDLVGGADAVVINGEGSMIFTREARREQRLHLAVMQLAIDLDVPFVYVNALASDPPEGPPNQAMRAATARVLAEARLVTVRDPESLAYLRDLDPKIRARFVPDALFSWADAVASPASAAALSAPEFLVPHHEHPDRLGRWDFSRPYLCVGGSSQAAKDPARARSAYAGLLERLTGLEIPVVVTVSCLGDAFLEDLAVRMDLPVVPATTNVRAAAAILAGAEVAVTGRYHPAILAGLGGVPAVLLGSDSHKTRSVQQVLGYPDIAVFPAFPDAATADAVVARARRLLAERHVWSAAIQEAVARRQREAQGLSGLLREALGEELVAPSTTTPAAHEESRR